MTLKPGYTLELKGSCINYSRWDLTPRDFDATDPGKGEQGGGQPCIEIFKNSPDDLNVHVAKFDNHTMFFESESRSVVSDSLRPPGLYSPWNSPGQNTGVGSLSLFQGIFPTQGSNP